MRIILDVEQFLRTMVVVNLLGVSWTGQKRNRQEKDLLFRGTEIGKIPLITELLANPKFQTYYLDFMEWFINQHFNMARVQAIEASRWSILEQSVYLEADTPDVAAHTNRPWSNDQVYRSSILGQRLSADQWPVAGIQVGGIDSFIEARCKKALGQLAKMTRASSGVDFDSDNWVLPV